MTNTSTPVLEDKFMSKYNIKNPMFIGEGSQKRVFCVEKDGKRCILKLFKDFSQRDLRELEIYKKYNKINGIPEIFAIHQYGDETIVFEEEIIGKPLEEICSEYRDNAESISELLIKIVEFLEPLWIDNIVHRDLKPSNIIVKEENIPIVIDFGIAKNFDNTSITSVSFQPHSWKFAAPEQLLAQKENISYRTDFFALGVLAYFLYFQELPFGDTKEKVEKHFANKQIILQIDDNCKIKEIISNLLEFYPSYRPAKITKLKKILTI